jgi:hypothetical protein
MRTMIKVQIPVDSGNKAILDNSLPAVVGEFLEKHRPEAAYFGTESGLRTMTAVIDLKDPSMTPVIAEPFFMKLSASVQFHPVMNAEELKAGLSKLGK